jgi:hypothetical protein
VVRERYGIYLSDLFNHAKDFWRANVWILVVFVAALLADGISTIYFMLHEGADTELHPAVNFVSRIAGPVLGPLIAVACKAIAGIIVAIYWRRIAAFILLLVSIISFWAAWYNIWGWQVYEANILRGWPF